VEFIPAGAFNNSIETFAKRATGDAQTIDRARIRLDQVALAQYNGVDAEIIGNFGRDVPPQHSAAEWCHAPAWGHRAVCW